jgi:hypothetical protein
MCSMNFGDQLVGHIISYSIYYSFVHMFICAYVLIVCFASLPYDVPDYHLIDHLYTYTPIHLHIYTPIHHTSIISTSSMSICYNIY